MNLELNMPHNFVYKKGFSSAEDFLGFCEEDEPRLVGEVRIEREIAAAEPNATVSRNMLILSRSDTAKSEQKIKDWAKGL